MIRKRTHKRKNAQKKKNEKNEKNEKGRGPNPEKVKTSRVGAQRQGSKPRKSVRGALLAKGPDSSLGEVHKGSCSEDIHMEEEKVEVKVQEEVEDRERQ